MSTTLKLASGPDSPAVTTEKKYEREREREEKPLGVKQMMGRDVRICGLSACLPTYQSLKL